MIKVFALATCFGVAVACSGCKDDGKPQTPAGGGGSASTAPSGGQTGGAKEEHNRIPIGEATAAGLKLVATMDEAVKPGGEGAFDVTITGGKPKAVRFWVGTESGEGSVKSKADEESPDTWHTHVEVPDPIPAGSKLWVEVEPQTGAPARASFELKQN